MAGSRTESDDDMASDADVYGNVDDGDVASIEARLSPKEQISLIAGLNIKKVPGITKDKGRKLLVVTNHRLLAYSSQDVRLLGERSTFSDINIHSIKDMDVEEHKGFDRITIRTESGEKTFMTPDKIGIKITGRIRELQEHGDPLDDLERLSHQHEEGNITDEEYQSKKDDLLERV
jgi:NACalpha-BTF3-like transcription factor